MNAWRHQFVKQIYATHNSSDSVQRGLQKSLMAMRGREAIGLNIGSGSSQIDERIINLDLVPIQDVDCCAFAEALPINNDSVDLVITQETMEHVRAVFVAIEEVYRVLKPGGTFYCQVPFVIGYHPGPTDFWRFSVEGIVAMLEMAGFRCIETGIAVGPATGFYRIAVEFFATLAAVASPSAYIPVKGLSALCLFPIKLLDGILLKSPQADRIAGGYYVIAQKAD